MYIEGAGVELGEYHAGRIPLPLRSCTPPTRAFFVPPVSTRPRWKSLAIDPRAYDFDHPVNKRPNYHFGQWDPHCIDNQGRYRRFVVQQVTLQALMARLEEVEEMPPEELLFEAAGVLAGTILMASGISGSGPDTHDSSVTLIHPAADRGQLSRRFLRTVTQPMRAGPPGSVYGRRRERVTSHLVVLASI